MKLITGHERSTDDRRINAVIDFYRAFNSGNMDLMKENWVQDEAVVMCNPIGGIKRGWEDIRSVYENIFHGPLQVYVEFHDFTLHGNSETFTIIGRERGWFENAGLKVELAIRTSRVFEEIDGRWGQVHHHGSIENPGLLEAYQAAFMISSKEVRG